MTIGGSNSLAGALAYVTALNVPTGKLGSALNSKLTQLTGVSNIQGTERVTLGLNIGGTVTSPSVKLTSGSVKDQGKAIVTNVVKTKLTDALLGLATKNKAKTGQHQNRDRRRQPDGRGKGAPHSGKSQAGSAGPPQKPDWQGPEQPVWQAQAQAQSPAPADTTKPWQRHR